VPMRNDGVVRGILARSGIISQCADDTDYLGVSNSSRNTSMQFVRHEKEPSVGMKLARRSKKAKR
jgi:hypothetical protein